MRPESTVLVVAAVGALSLTSFAASAPATDEDPRAVTEVEIASPATSTPPATSAAPAEVAGPVAPGQDTEGHDDRPGAVSTVFPPRTLRIPAIGVDAEVGAVGLSPDRTVEVPADIHRPGWYDRLSQPGDPGVTAIVGHVDGTDGAGVFFRLHELTEGDRVEVERADHEIVTYEVVTVSSHPKDDFPTQAVFADPRDEVLQLITCGGPFDPVARSYTDNIVVTAVPVT